MVNIRKMGFKVAFLSKIDFNLEPNGGNIKDLKLWIVT